MARITKKDVLKQIEVVATQVGFTVEVNDKMKLAELQDVLATLQAQVETEEEIIVNTNEPIVTVTEDDAVFFDAMVQDAPTVEEAPVVEVQVDKKQIITDLITEMKKYTTPMAIDIRVLFDQLGLDTKALYVGQVEDALQRVIGIYADRIKVIDAIVALDNRMKKDALIQKTRKDLVAMYNHIKQQCGVDESPAPQNNNQATSPQGGNNMNNNQAMYTEEQVRALLQQQAAMVANEVAATPVQPVDEKALAMAAINKIAANGTDGATKEEIELVIKYLAPHERNLVEVLKGHAKGIMLQDYAVGLRAKGVAALDRTANVINDYGHVAVDNTTNLVGDVFNAVVGVAGELVNLTGKVGGTAIGLTNQVGHVAVNGLAGTVRAGADLLR